MTAASNLILVDSNDQQVGVAEKMRCHVGDGLLHRAFSVFLRNGDGSVLLQQRSAAKPLWPLYWSNACCGHPMPGEAVGDAARRRTHEELGVHCQPEFVYKFQYQARYSEELSEHELCHVFEGECSAELQPDPSEVAAWRWVAPSALTREIADYPERFSPWMKLEWAELRRRDHS